MKVYLIYMFKERLNPSVTIDSFEIGEGVCQFHISYSNFHDCENMNAFLHISKDK